MSYDFRIINKKNHKTVNTGNHVCDILDYGGTIRVNPEDMSPARKIDFEFNMTYNYSQLLYKYIDSEKGLRYLYGLDFNSCIDTLETAIKNIRKDYIKVLDKDVDGRQPHKQKYVEILKTNTYDIPKKKPTIKQMESQESITDDYWACTPNNVIKALQHVLDCMYWIKAVYPEKTYRNFTFLGD